MRNARLDEAQAGIKISGRNINNLRYADDTTLMAESEEESEKGDLKSSKNKDHGIWSHHFMANRWVNNENSERFYFLGLQNHCRWWLQPWNKRCLLFGRKAMTNPKQRIKKQSHYFANKDPSTQSYDFSSSHVWTWKLDHKESWALKNWCFWTVVQEKTPESSLDSKEIQPVNPKGNQSHIFFRRTDAEAEAPLLWLPDVKNWLIGKDPDAGKEWR